MAGNVINMKDLQVFVDRTVLDRPFFNTRFALLVSVLNGLALRMDANDQIASTLVATGLQRINDTLGPFLTLLQEAAQQGFLVADATGVSKSLTEGVDVAFVLTSSGASLFTPTPFVMAMDKTDHTNWGMLELTVWDKPNLTVSAHCIYASKTQASTQWTLSASSGVIPAMVDLLASAVAAETSAAASAATAASDAADLADLAAAIASGPVASVAGRTGNVTLGQSDIAGLVSDLAAKVDTSAMTTALAGKQSVSAILTTLAGLTYAANKLIMATSPSAFTTISVGSFGQSLLACADQAAARTLLGIGDTQSIDGGTF